MNMNNNRLEMEQGSVNRGVRLAGFVWQHLLLICSLFMMTIGVALTIRSDLGSSVISSIPMVMTLAGADGKTPGLTVGEYTNLMNAALVLVQILILRRRFEKVQLLQLVIGAVFGFLLDVSMWITAPIAPETLAGKILAQVGGCLVLGVAIAFEVRCGSVTMPGEGVPAAISKAFGMHFAKAKIIVDISLVAIAVTAGYLFFGHWLLNVVGPGTLFAMIFVGLVVKFTARRIGWFDKVLHFHPGFKGFFYGLVRYLRRHHIDED